MRSVLRFLARADFLFYLLIGLMVLLTVGTIAQKYIGLYLSQKIYFSSFVVWLGEAVPVPGGYTILALIFINLFAKLLIEPWSVQKAGTIIIHCGALLLLIGGGLTARYSTEGAIVINEGATSNYISDYHARELAVIDPTDASFDAVTAFGPGLMQAGKELGHESLPFTIRIERYCGNCWVVPRKEPLTDPDTHGFFLKNDLQVLPPFPEDERNRAGVVMQVAGAGKEADGRYALFEDMPVDQTITAGGKTYILSLRRQRTYLPFSMTLVNFDKQVHPGTDTPRSYSSEIILRDGAMQWRSIISMNSPLRYKGYTFFQSSFFEQNGSQATVLAAVTNIGKIFPYISSIIICIGLLVHMVIRIPQLTARKREDA